MKKLSKEEIAKIEKLSEAKQRVDPFERIKEIMADPKLRESISGLWDDYPNHRKIVFSEPLTAREKSLSLLANNTLSLKTESKGDKVGVSIIHQKEAIDFSETLFELENTYVTVLPLGKYRGVVYTTTKFETESLGDFYDLVKDNTDKMYFLYVIEFLSTTNKWVIKYGVINLDRVL